MSGWETGLYCGLGMSQRWLDGNKDVFCSWGEMGKIEERALVEGLNEQLASLGGSGIIRFGSKARRRCSLIR